MAFIDLKWLNSAMINPLPVNVYIFDYPDAMASAVYGVKDLLTITNHQAGSERFVCQIITAFSEPDELLIRGDTLVFIPPCLSRELPDFLVPDVLSKLKAWHQAGAVMVAACAGVFWLANAELLDGKQATTHWLLCDKLVEKHPRIDAVKHADMVVDQGDVITAAGVYAFQDLTLHLIARYAGYDLAKKVSDFSLLDFNGRLQAYYQRFYPTLNHGDALIFKAQKYCDSHLNVGFSIEQLADYCHSSPRTLLRRFKLATGFSTKQYIIQLKVERAKQRLEQSNISVEDVAYQLGYTDSSNFIKIFKKVSGITPSEFQTRKNQ